MNKSESKYFNTAVKMDKALLSLLEKKDFEYITIKEICKEAHVNRSTFYLHYENTVDLLQETIQHNIQHFLTYFDNLEDIISNINDFPLEKLILVREEYLKPYLKYVKENKRLFQTIMKQNQTFDTHHAYENIFKHIFNPIMERYGIVEKERRYITAFYIKGIVAIVEEWLKNDCQDSIEEMINIITKCVLSKRE